MKRYSICFVSIVALLLCLIGGCSGKVQVTGTVTYSDDNSSVNSGEIVFSDGTNSARGGIKNGRYSMGLLKDGEGIPKGTYQVTAESIRQSLGGQPTESFSMPQPMTVEVKQKMSVDIVVDRLKSREVPSNIPRGKR